MILTAHQPVYLPWQGYFHKIALADRFVCYDHVHFSNYDYTTRNTILTPTGTLRLVVPVQKHDIVNKPLRDVRIDNSRHWRRKHWLSLQQAYGKAPYFAMYADFLAGFYDTPWSYLCEMNMHLISWMLGTLGIQRQIEYSSSLGIAEAKGDGVLEMCEKLGADMFIFGAQGKNYADANKFARAGIKTIFQDYRCPTYPQTSDGFISHLSTIDLLFNCGPASLEILMKANATRGELVKL